MSINFSYFSSRFFRSSNPATTPLRPIDIIITYSPEIDKVVPIEDFLTYAGERGVTSIRINLSHGDLSDWEAAHDTIQKVQAKTKIPFVEMFDFPGIKYRIGKLLSPVVVQIGETAVFTSAKADGLDCSDFVFPFASSEFIGRTKVGNELLIDDGQIKLRVIDVTADAITGRVTQGGRISSKKGMTCRGDHFTGNPITERDVEIMGQIKKFNPQVVVQSFVGKGEDVKEFRRYLRAAGLYPRKVIAKVETPYGIENRASIAKACDVGWIGRGDLSVEGEPDDIPYYEDLMLETFRQANKPCHVCTSVLRSMVYNPSASTPERVAIYNELKYGASGFLLSNEITQGPYPLLVIDQMLAAVEKALIQLRRADAA